MIYFLIQTIYNNYKFILRGKIIMNIKELIFGKSEKKVVNELALEEKREQLINEYHRLTDEIKQLENMIIHSLEEQADALRDGIAMYSKLRSSVYRQICEIDGKSVNETRIAYSKNKINIIRNGQAVVL